MLQFAASIAVEPVAISQTRASNANGFTPIGVSLSQYPPQPRYGLEAPGVVVCRVAQGEACPTPLGVRKFGAP